ncbi:GMC family oxidoreductase [Mycobacterium sp. 050134]|uniref:GMC family oxidoreductase n=1 Tax=Mycobacterium sp. 050134 TaxID=3096111 RepID=UPI002ED7F3F8
MSALSPAADAVVVGSGFGGSIAACRLAQAGRSVVVLERGRRYGPQDFPRDVTDTDALLWRHENRRKATGLYDVRFFSALGCVVAAGVGGGSLVYANVHIRPDPAVFDDPRWPEGTNRVSLDPYYQRVADMFAVAPLPASIRLAKRDAFHSAASRLGRECFDPDAAVHWPQPPDPPTSRGTCQLVAECELGCRFGAKRSADTTYLAEAERCGARVWPGQVVVELRRCSDGYEVRHRDVGTGAEHVTVGRRVVLAAGTLGTSELLLRCRDQLRSLPQLSPILGQGFSANGDFLGSVSNAKADLAPDRGPDVTSVMRFCDQAPEFTLAAPTFHAPVMKALAAMGRPSAGLPRPVALLLWRLLPALVPWAFAHGVLSRSALAASGDPGWRRSTNLIAIGRDNAGGRLHLTRRGLDVRWNYRTDNAELIDRIERAMAEVSGCYGGTFTPNMFWKVFRRIFTVHPLGGCRIAESPAQGVVSPVGEVHGYPGLFIADGSVVPTALGFHPAMTISALAERTAAAVVADSS